MGWKERIKKEYADLKERCEKLKAYNNKLEVKCRISRFGGSPLGDGYRRDLLRLRKQQRGMREYLRYLKLRAELEDIEL